MVNGEKGEVMPRKGLPRCSRCRCCVWQLVSYSETTATISCESCGTRAITRSNARWRLIYEWKHSIKAAEAAGEE